MPVGSKIKFGLEFFGTFFLNIFNVRLIKSLDVGLRNTTNYIVISRCSEFFEILFLRGRDDLGKTKPLVIYYNIYILKMFHGLSGTCDLIKQEGALSSPHNLMIIGWQLHLLRLGAQKKRSRLDVEWGRASVGHRDGDEQEAE